jgi:hypothetical protein
MEKQVRIPELKYDGFFLHYRLYNQLRHEIPDGQEVNP